MRPPVNQFRYPHARARGGGRRFQTAISFLFFCRLPAAGAAGGARRRSGCGATPSKPMAARARDLPLWRRVNRLATSHARARQRRATGRIRPALWTAPAISFLWNDGFGGAFLRFGVFAFRLQTTRCEAGGVAHAHGPPSICSPGGLDPRNRKEAHRATNKPCLTCNP